MRRGGKWRHSSIILASDEYLASRLGRLSTGEQVGWNPTWVPGAAQERKVSCPLQEIEHGFLVTVAPELSRLAFL
jgi:hypothetical protein